MTSFQVEEMRHISSTSTYTVCTVYHASHSSVGVLALPNIVQLSFHSSHREKMQSWHSKAHWMKASTTWHRGAVCGQFLAAGLFLLFILQLINIKLLTKEKKSISKSKATWQGIIFHPLLWFIICPSWCDVLPFSFPTSAKCNLEVYCGKQQGLHSSGFSHLAGRKVCVDLLMSWNDNEEKKWCVFEKGSESECGSP